jgi:hypothetical protein
MGENLPNLVSLVVIVSSIHRLKGRKKFQSDNWSQSVERLELTLKIKWTMYLKLKMLSVKIFKSMLGGYCVNKFNI